MTDIALRLVQFKYDDSGLALTFPEVLREGAEEIKKLCARVKELEGDRAQMKDGYVVARKDAAAAREELAGVRRQLKSYGELLVSLGSRQ